MPLTRRQRIELFARLMDTCFSVPGTRIRFGWDNVLGLAPGIGDSLSMLLALYLILEAMAAGAPVPVIQRMAANVAADWAIGIVPVAGDALDVAFKGNRRNARLLLDWMDAPLEASRRSRTRTLLLAAGMALGALALLAGGIWLAVWIAHRL